MTGLTPPRILFRCDASPTLGFGHLMRCRALAYALKQAGAQCAMIGPSLKYRLPADQDVFDSWIPGSPWKSSQEDAALLISCAMANPGQSIIVLDDYRVDETYQQVLLKSGLRWLQFDNKADKPLWADWVLNASPAAREEDYTGLLQKSNALALIGPQYAVLRPEFSAVPSRTYEKSDSMDVLVTFGGGDDRGAILFTLQALLPATSPEIRYHVISGSQNPRNAEIERWIQSTARERVTLHVNPECVASIFLDCDVAVMAGGTTTFEAAACSLPMILMTIAENQVRQAQAWHDLGAAAYLGMYGEVSADKLIREFSKFTDVEVRKQMGDRGALIVNGRGAERAARELLNSEKEY